MVGRVLGWIFVALGLAVFARDVWVFLESGAVAMTPLGQLWFSLHAGSLNLVQAVVERYLHPFLWDPVIFSVLRLPASLLFLAIGVILVLAFRPRRRRYRNSSFT